MLDELFHEAYLLARRSATVRTAAVLHELVGAGLDREDIVQEVTVSVWLTLWRFDRRRASLPTFVENIRATKIASILRRSRAQKRTKTETNNPIRTSRFTVELRLDVLRALRTLNQNDQKIARLLIHFDATEVAHILSCSRAAVYRGKGRIRKALEQFGLDKY